MLLLLISFKLFILYSDLSYTVVMSKHLGNECYACRTKMHNRPGCYFEVKASCVDPHVSSVLLFFAAEVIVKVKVITPWCRHLYIWNEHIYDV